MSAHLFGPGMFLGSLLIALWVYVRIPVIRPGSFGGAVAHVAASFLLLHVAPVLVDVWAGAVRPPLAIALSIGTVVVPALCYIYVSWLWLIGKISEFLSRGPGGGHLVHPRG